MSKKSRVQEPQGHTDWNTRCPFTPFPSSRYLGQSDVMQASPTHGITTASMSTTPSDQTTCPSYSLGIPLTRFSTFLHWITMVAIDTKQAPDLTPLHKQAKIKLQPICTTATQQSMPHLGIRHTRNMQSIHGTTDRVMGLDCPAPSGEPEGGS